RTPPPPEPRAGLSTKSRYGARISASRRRSHCSASVAYVAGTGMPAASNRRLALGLWSTIAKSGRGLYGTRNVRLRRFMPSVSRRSRRTRSQKPLTARSRRGRRQPSWRGRLAAGEIVEPDVLEQPQAAPLADQHLEDDHAAQDLRTREHERL